MKDSRKCAKTSNGNKHNNSGLTPGNHVSTSKVSTPQERIDMRIPKKSKIYQYLYGDTTNIKVPKWKQLDAILLAAQHNKEVHAVKLYDIFVKSIGVFYPDKIEKLNKLRPLIIKHILKGDKLDESYYKDLKEL